MGLVFEHLIRLFAENSNETACDHFTPRDIVHLATSLVFMEDDEALTEMGIIRTIYDPTAGTGGFLSSGMEYVHELNPKAVMRAFGQELNPESCAICKSDMLIKGQDVGRIKLGNTLSEGGGHETQTSKSPKEGTGSWTFVARLGPVGALVPRGGGTPRPASASPRQGDAPLGALANFRGRGSSKRRPPSDRIAVNSDVQPRPEVIARGRQLREVRA